MALKGEDLKARQKAIEAGKRRFTSGLVTGNLMTSET